MKQLYKIKLLQLVFLVFSIAQTFHIQAQNETKLTASDGVFGDLYGVSVSGDGDRVVVGAYGDDDNGPVSGSAYIHEWNGSSWTEIKLLASDGGFGDEFGRMVSLNSNRVIVGASKKLSSRGAAYIYEWDGMSWVETKLTASDATDSDRFGWSVSVSWNRVVVGAYGDDDNGSASGSVYVYEWDGMSWVETKLTASDGAANDLFGWSVSVSGDRIVVGATGDDDKGSASGSAYVYEWDGMSWVETKLTASDGALGDNFGESVSIDGNRIVIGSWQDDDNGSNSGSVYVYEWDGMSWVETKLTASDGSADDFFGADISINGDRLVAGAVGDDDKGSNSGSVYVYEWDGMNWVETKLTASDGAAGDNFSSGVSVFGDRLIVGAFNDDDNGSNSGSSYVYELVCPSGILTNTYSDTGSGLWLDSANWSLNEIPTTCHNVVIPDGQTAHVLVGESAECFTLEVQEGGEIEVPEGATLDVVVDN